MTAAHAAVMIGHGDQIVDGLPVIRVNDILRHVQAPSRELHHGVELVPPVTVVAEPFEADHKERGKGPQIELLCCLLMFLAVRTVPRLGGEE